VEQGHENIVKFLKHGASLKITADQVHAVLGQALLEGNQRMAGALDNYAAAMGWQGDGLRLFGNEDLWNKILAHRSKI
jgi:hypothetical protein